MCLEPNNDNNNIRKVSNVYGNINYGVISDVKGEDKKRGRRLEEARKREVARKRKRLQ